MTERSATPSDPTRDVSKPGPRYEKWLILAILALALALRLGHACTAVVTPASDFLGYEKRALHWLEDGEFGWPNSRAYRTPGYPAFLAVLFWSGIPARFAHAGIGVVSVLLLYWWVRKRTARIAPAAIAALLLACSPTAIVYTSLSATENLATPLALAAMLLASSTRIMAQAGAGIVSTALVLVRPAGVLLVPGLLLASVLAGRRNWGRSLVLLIAFGASLAPWFWYTHRSGLGITLSTAGPVNLWMGNGPHARDGGYHRKCQDAPTRDEAASAAYYKERAIDWVRENPGRYLRLVGVRLARLMGFRPDIWAVYYYFANETTDAAMRHRLLKQPVDDAVRVEARRQQQEAELILVRFRYLSRPLLMAGLLLALVALRRHAWLTLPYGSYILGIAATFVAERFRELTNPLECALIALLLSDVLVGTRTLPGNRLAKAVVLGLTVLASSIVVRKEWDVPFYRLVVN